MYMVIWVALGSVHTWCPGTSIRAPAQNGAVFRHTVPSLKICSHSINSHFEISSGTRNCGYENKWFVGKVPGHQRKMCSHKDSVPSLVPEFWRGYQEKRCVHIGARRRIEPGHGARAPSVNTALLDLSRFSWFKWRNVSWKKWDFGVLPPRKS